MVYGTIRYVRHGFLLVYYSNFSIARAVFQIFDLKNVLTLKFGSEVTQDHRNWYRSKDWLWFPISVLWKLCP